MQTTKNKTMAIMVSTLLIISMSASIMLIPNANAHTPVWQFTTHALITALPNTVGVGQTATIYMFLGNAPIPSSALTNTYRFHNYKLTITAPDGSTTTQSWDTVQDTTNNQAYTFAPDQVGTYNFTFNYGGQTLTASDQPSGSLYVNDTYLPSSASTTLTVQQETIPNSPVNVAPFPTEYWTRPIYGQNTDWWSISSNWLGSGAPVNSATGYGTISGISFSSSFIQRYPGDAVGPTTSHVMWTYPIEDGGVVGGNQSYVLGNTYFDGSAYNQRFTNPIIIAGKLYYTLPLSFTGPNSGSTVCQDLKTGQIIWSRTDVPALSFGYIYDVQDPNQHGTFPAILFTSNFARGFDAYTGNPLFNVTGVPTGSAVQGPQGEQLRYVIANAGNTTNPDYRLGEWNSSKLWIYTGISPALTNQSGTTITNPPSTTATSVVDGSISMPGNAQNRYDWNISIPWRNIINTTSTVTVLAAFYNNMLLCMNGSYPNFSFGANYLSNPYTYFAVDINPAHASTFGQVLWRTTYDAPPGNVTVSFGGADPTVGVFVENYKETINWAGFSMTTGAKLWGPTAPQTALDFYGQEGFLAGQVAYGKLYTTGYAGIVYCYDLTNGNILWTYGNGGAGNSTQSYFQVPGNYPTYINAVGNGIIYTVTSEHTIQTPIYKGAMARALNATTGQEIWTLSNDNNEFSVMSYAMADGYSTLFNAYDDQIYSVGQGPSATTVTAPDAGLSFGQSVVIKGTVMDISAGTKQNQQASDFPNGVPVASDAIMTQWMGYVYQQQPMPPTFTGVTVSIDVIDSNGNYRNIGTTTTTATGTYSFAWTPDISGTYQVIATFHGNNAYWGSYAQTAFDVMHAPAATTAPTSTPTSAADKYFVPAIVGLFVLIIIIGVVLALLMLRKRP